MALEVGPVVQAGQAVPVGFLFPAGHLAAPAAGVDQHAPDHRPVRPVLPVYVNLHPLIPAIGHAETQRAFRPGRLLPGTAAQHIKEVLFVVFVQHARSAHKRGGVRVLGNTRHNRGERIREPDAAGLRPVQEGNNAGGAGTLAALHAGIQQRPFRVHTAQPAILPGGLLKLFHRHRAEEHIALHNVAGGTAQMPGLLQVVHPFGHGGDVQFARHL